MTELSKRLAYKREIARHLRELGLLLDRVVREDQLLSLAEMEQIRASARETERKPKMRFEVPFHAKREPRFRKFLEELAIANPSSVYLWTPVSNICGIMRPVALSELSVGFPFDVNPEGIVTILTSDYRDQLLLDYSLDDKGGQHLEVEGSGSRWGVVAY